MTLQKATVVLLGCFLVALLVTTGHFLRPTSDEYSTQRFLQETPEIKEPAKNEIRNQIIVMGMHNTGTSLITQILISMGAYGGQPDDLISESSMADEYISRKDVSSLNQWLFNSRQSTKGPKWSGYEFSLDQVPPKKKATFVTDAKEILQKLNQHPTWVTKDHRFSLLLPLWRSILSSPICVITYRHPTYLLRSLMTYDGLSPGDWLALWENYTMSSLEACAGIPTIYVSQDELDSNIYSLVSRIHAQLQLIGVSDLRLPSEDEISSLKTSPKQTDPPSEYIPSDSLRILAQSQKRLVKIFQSMFETRSFILPSEILKQRLPNKGRQAYATFFHPDDEIELVAVLTLLHSIRQTDRERDMIVLTDSTPNQNTTKLFMEFGARIVQNPPFPDYFSQNPLCTSVESGSGNQTEFSVLRAWQLDEYDKILFLRPGGLVFPPVHEIFLENDIFCAEKERKGEGFKTHFFVLEPDQTTFAEMTKLLEMHQSQNTTPFFQSVPDCSIQGFLNEFYTLFKPIKIGRPDFLNHDYHSDPPAVAHPFSSKCPEPWDLSQPPPDMNKDAKSKEPGLVVQNLVGMEQITDSLPNKKRNVRCGLPRGCNASLYRSWWNTLSALDSLFHQKSLLLREYWFDLLHRKQLYYGCSRSV